MADQAPMPIGTFCWTELMTRDVAAAKKFYNAMFGWSMKDDQISGRAYTMFTAPGTARPTGGMMQIGGPEFEHVPPHWLPYILVKSVADSAKQCVQLGGQVKHPPTVIPNVGSFCVIQDPTGAVVALFQGK